MLSEIDFRKAAGMLARLAGGEAETASPCPEADALIGLGYLDKDLRLEGGTFQSGLPHLIAFASELSRLFALPVGTMPGLCFFGAQRMLEQVPPGGMRSGPANYGGSGLSPHRAFESCLGEAVEHSASLSDKARPLAPEASSTGFAAGRTAADARNAAAAECMERDSLAEWFCSGATLTEIAPDIPLLRLLRALRRSQPVKTRFLLVDNPKVPWPTVIALSEPGGDRVTGYGCAASLQKACLKALCELGQGELGLNIERQRDEPNANGFLARSGRFRADGHLFVACETADLGNLASGFDRSGEPLATFRFTDLTQSSVGIPCVHARHPLLRDICREIPDGEVAPL